MDDLLKVLDMSEEEQIEWVEDNCEMEGYECEMEGYEAPISKLFVITESFADFAFRLRNEAVENDHTAFHNSIYVVQHHLKQDDWATAFWGEVFAQPIHWIIAALIAKGKK